MKERKDRFASGISELQALNPPTPTPTVPVKAPPPTDYSGGMDVRTTISISKAEIDAIDLLAKRLGIKRSAYIRILIRKHLESPTELV